MPSVFDIQQSRKVEGLREAVRQLYHWRFAHPPATNFTARLYDLFIKSDPVNFEKLRQAFPAEALAVERWRQARSEGAFFRDHGVHFNGETKDGE